MKKELVLFLSCAANLIAASACDGSPECKAKTKCAPMVRSGDVLTAQMATPMILKSARFETGDQWDCSFNIAFNEYYAMQEGMAVAALSISGSEYNDPSGSILDFDFTYHPGFQVGLTVNTPYDKWVIAAEYMWFRSTTTVSGTAPADYYYYSPFFNNGFNTGLASLSAHWKLGVDLIDFYLNRPFYAGMRWTVEPQFGLRAGWIRQHVRMTTTPASDASALYNQTATLNSHSWLLGPRGGMQTNFLLGMGFNIFGDCSMSLLYTRYPTISVVNTDTHGDENVGTNNGYSALTPNIDAGLGLKWGSYFSGQAYHFDLSVAYNFSAYFSQNQIQAVTTVLNNGSGFAPGNLYLHGVSISTSFMF